jgi:ribosomal protein RSM22 (predicted rRNA methylase)
LLTEAVRPDGTLVIIEPALRERTRHLHAVRDTLLATGAISTVFAPCLHAGPCPMLKTGGDWCHEDVPVDLPSWLAPIARAAGLRWQGLTYSYLVLRPDGATLRSRGFPWRVVSGALLSKGKRELFLCGDASGSPVRERVQRLDRHASPSNAAWEALGRGDRVRISPATAGARRIGPNDDVDVDRFEE